eukprot:Colp12_sorted_trinity150504_noHs@13349
MRSTKWAILAFILLIACGTSSALTADEAKQKAKDLGDGIMAFSFAKTSQAAQGAVNFAKSLKHTVSKGHDWDWVASYVRNQYVMKDKPLPLSKSEKSYAIDYGLPIVICAGIGAAFALLIPIVGMIVACCRSCCGNCGGYKYQTNPSSGCRLGLIISYFISTTFLFCMVCLMFWSNSRIHDSPQQIENATNQMFDAAQVFQYTTFNQIDNLAYTEVDN